MDNKKVFVFIGRSGCGKGTQLELLREYLSKKYSNFSYDTLIMGDIYRNFFNRDGYFIKSARDLSMKDGKFQPDFLTNSLLVNNTIDIVKENSVLFFDGYPRTSNQLEILKSLVSYLGYEEIIVLNIEVSRESVKERMLLRGRGDDNEKAIEMRLSEYDNNVLPMINQIKSDSFFRYFEIDGEPSIEDIHKNIINILEV